MGTINIIALIIQTIPMIVLAYYALLLGCKIAYYERTLENNKHLFSDERYAHIEKVKRMKNLFKKLD